MDYRSGFGKTCHAILSTTQQCDFQEHWATGWYDMLYSLWEDPQGWLEEYHMRSISETVNSMVKCRFGAHAQGNGLNRGRRLRRG